MCEHGAPVLDDVSDELSPHAQGLWRENFPVATVVLPETVEKWMNIERWEMDEHLKDGDKEFIN